MAKKLNIEQATQSLVLLAQQFPECFTLATPQPLKINIKQDILEAWGTKPYLSKTKLQQALFYYTHSAAYLNAFKVEPVRVDLQGNPVEDVLNSDRDHAAKQYTLRYSKPKAKPSKAPARHDKNGAAPPHSFTPRAETQVKIIKKPSSKRLSSLKKPLI
jgi:sRNA-binding protein